MVCGVVCLCAQALRATLSTVLFVSGKRLLAVALSTKTNCDTVAYYSLCCLLAKFS